MHEVRLLPAPDRLAELRLIDRADPGQELELVPQVRAHHLRAVGRDRERHPVLDEAREVSRTASSSASAFVSRFEVGQSSSTISASPVWAISFLSCAARIPCRDISRTRACTLQVRPGRHIDSAPS
jgi:hypothetical protein